MDRGIVIQHYATILPNMGITVTRNGLSYQVT